jgi:hypothetical protein
MQHEHCIHIGIVPNGSIFKNLGLRSYIEKLRHHLISQLISKRLEGKGNCTFFYL